MWIVTLDPNRYTTCIPMILRLHTNRVKDEVTIEDLIPEISVATNVPIVAVCIFVKDIFGSTPRLEKMIEDLISFYHYDIIVPLKEKSNEAS